MILVLAGAGASCALDAQRYPTTAEFFKRLPKKVLRNKLFAQVCEFLKGPSAPAVIRELPPRRTVRDSGRPKRTAGIDRIDRHLQRSFDLRPFVGIINAKRTAAQGGPYLEEIDGQPDVERERDGGWCAAVLTTHISSRCIRKPLKPIERFVSRHAASPVSPEFLSTDAGRTALWWTDDRGV
jgi:hypothetical protein